MMENKSMIANDKFNFVYLFGAGASAQNKNEDEVNKKARNLKKSFTMPTATNIKVAINEVITFLKSLENKYVFKDPEKDIFKELFSDYNSSFSFNRRLIVNLIQLKGFITDYNTFDEGMRKLYLMRHIPKMNDLFELNKKLISLVFYILEFKAAQNFSSFKCYKDSRYSQFLLTIIDNNFQLPSNLTLLTWNYDNQFKIAELDFIENGMKSPFNEKNYIRLNGRSLFNNYMGVDMSETLLYDLKIIIEKKPTIKFAWEENNEDLLNQINYFKESIDEKMETIIVVIGYSFPFVNHKFDYSLLDDLKISKIYYQNSSELHFNDFKNKFSSYLNNQGKFVHIKHCDSFYIPPEFHYGWKPQQIIIDF